MFYAVKDHDLIRDPLHASNALLASSPVHLAAHHVLNASQVVIVLFQDSTRPVYRVHQVQLQSTILDQSIVFLALQVISVRWDRVYPRRFNVPLPLNIVLVVLY